MPPCRPFRFTWDSLGRRQTVTYPNSAVITYVYDMQDVLVSVHGNKPLNPPPPSFTDRFDFQYDAGTVNAVGRVHHQLYQCTSYSITDESGTPCGRDGVSRDVGSGYNIRGELLVQVAVEGGVMTSDSTAYDLSGNLGRRAKWDGGQAQQYTVDQFVTPASTNRLTSSIRTDTYIPFNLTYEYDADGARKAQHVLPFNGQTYTQERYWTYDALGRQAGYKFYDVQNGTPVLRYEPTNGCTYDPEGQVYRPCAPNSPLLAYEGSNVTRFSNPLYRFIDGPGVDDVLMARYYTSFHVDEIYFVTDGQGRQLTAADFDGSRQQVVWSNGDYSYAGTTANGSSFNATRMELPNQQGVSLFRNRAYDANSGRWLQEDPIGIAGGVNLYQFNGNNPVAYTDPFGLCPIEKDGMPCTLTMGGGALVAGAVSGAVAGGTGGSFVLPGVGTVAGASGGAVAGGTVGLIAGGLVGAAKDANSLLEMSGLGKKLRKLVETIGLVIAASAGDGPPPSPEPEKDKPPRPAPTSPKSVAPCVKGQTCKP